MFQRTIMILLVVGVLLLIAVWGSGGQLAGGAPLPPTPVRMMLAGVPTSAPTPRAPGGCVACSTGILIGAYDDGPGLGRITVECGSAITTYDLSWTPPARFCIGLVELMVPEDTTYCTVSAVNRDRNVSELRKSISGFSCHVLPGGDYPGDNLSAASADSLPAGEWVVMPEGARIWPPVAVLRAGFSDELVRLLLDLSEPSRMIEEGFAPVITVEQVPVLLIPSGGLYGLDHSPSFRARLEEYARRGGVVVAFAQQRGDEYGVLPGGELDGYGWREDTGCLSASLRMATEHPILSTFDHTPLTVHVRGYFTTYPDETTVLLTRAQDGMPAALVYPYGQGWVVVTSIYEDWGAAYGQSTADARVFIRSLLNWAIEPTRMDTYVPGELVVLAVPVSNDTGSEAASIRLSLIDPVGEIVQEQSAPVSLAAGDTTTLSFTTMAAMPLGIWRVDAALWGTGPYPLAPRAPVTHFVVANPSATVVTGATTQGGVTRPVAGVDLDVAAALDRAVYAEGETATLTLNVANRSALPTADLYAVVRYGDFEDTRSFRLAGNDSQALTFAVPVALGGGHLISYGVYDRASNCGLHLDTIRIYLAIPPVALYPDRRVYRPGDAVRVTVVTTATGELLVAAPGYSQTLTLTGHDTGFQFTLPAGLLRGTYAVGYALDGDTPHRVPFDVDAPWVRVTEAHLLDLPYAPGDEVHADLTIASTEPLEVTVWSWLRYPDGTRSAAMATTASLRAGFDNHISSTSPLSTTQAGPHRVVYLLADPGNPDRVYAAGAQVFDVGAAMVLGVHTDREKYRHTTEPVTATTTLRSVRETPVSIRLRLDGTFVVSQAVRLVTGTQTLALPVPGPLAPGWHTVRVEMVVEGMTSVAEADFLYGTAGPDLVVGEPSLYVPSGFTTTVRTWVHNEGREAVPTTTLRLYDGNPAVDGDLIAEVTVPPLAAGRAYYRPGEEFSVSWDVTGRAGLHTLYAVADADGVVPESDEENNTRPAEVEVPSLSLWATTDKPAYGPGEAVSITVRAANLQADGDLHVALTTTANLLGWKPFQVAESITIPAGTLVERQYTWEDTDTRGGRYNLVIKATGEMGTVRRYAAFALPYSAQFVATPLTGTAPLTVTFTDLSTPWGWVQTWLWDFGDGRTITEANPVHVYTAPGSFTVGLTTTVGVTTYVELKPDYITVIPH